MIILVLFILIPLVAAALVEYVVCRVTKRRWWKLVPPVLGGVLVAAIAYGRYQLWESEVPPWTQLMFMPGLPGIALFLGFLIGWRLWRRLWRPRVIRDKFKK